MKRISAILIALTLAGTIHAQKLVEDQKDEFTNINIKRTSWEYLIRSFKLSFAIRASKLDQNYSLDVKIMIPPTQGNIFSISQGNSLMLKLERGKVIDLKAMKSETTSKGAGATGFSGSGAYGIEMPYTLTNEDIEALLNEKVVKIRFYTSYGYVEDDIKEKKSDIILKEIQLVQ